jgi:Ca2+-binding RTX toxin-like protein
MSIKSWYATGVGLAFALVPSIGHGQQVRTDLDVKLVPGSMAAFTLDGTNGPITRFVPILDGEVRLRTDPNGLCNSIPTSGCSSALNYVSLVFGDLNGVEFGAGSTTIGVVDLVQPSVFHVGGSDIIRTGTAFPVPGNLPTVANAFLFGSLDGNDLLGALMSRGGKLPSGVQYDFRTIPDELFTLQGSFPFQVVVNGHTVGGSITVLASGETPFVNAPPRAFAGADVTTTCGAPVTLNGSQSSDPDGASDIVAFRWFDANGIALGTGATLTIPAPQGQSIITLEVEDAFGGIGRDTVTITSQGNVAPVITAPPTAFASTCGTVNIGQATAVSSCGQVVITSNAPASFLAGVTTVTWTGTLNGVSSTATQRVVVGAGDNPACCPPGYNRILGNSNDNTLVGTVGSDCILGFGGQDHLFGRGGNDIISGGQGDDEVRGEGGNDVLSAGSGQDHVFGADGNDSLLGEDGDDELRGETGDDAISGGQGQDLIVGGDGADMCFGDTGDDRLFGEGGNDLLDGGDNNDQCTGGAGTDTALSCTPQDTFESFGEPAFPGNASYDLCQCRPTKCTDCSTGVTQCNGISGCRNIIECVQQTPNCNLPHECSSSCESGRSPQAIDAARQLASCFGGCL